MLNLDLSDLLGEGNERQCFSHPHDDTLCIKVNKKSVIHRNQNSLELIYIKSLKKRDVPFTHMATFYGTTDTNLGSALVYERICNGDGSPSLTITEALNKNILTKDTLNCLLVKVFNYLIENWISIGDVNIDQMLLKVENDGYRLILIDGLGTRRKGLKLFLSTHFPFIARRKTRKNWKKLLRKIDKITEKDVAQSYLPQ